MPTVGDVARRGWLRVDSLLGLGPDFRHQPLGENIDPGGLEGYWCDLRHKSIVADASPDEVVRDSAGNPIDWVIPLAQAALGAWERRYYGENTEERFLALARRLRDAATQDDDGSLRWCVWVPVPKYSLEPGWATAMGQAQAISVFLRAEKLTGDGAWREAAERSFRPLLRPVEDRGLQRVIDGALVLEEYPTDQPCAVLNGWLFSLLGVYELAQVTGDARARELFDRSRAGLLSLLPRYDVEWWSLYSLFDHGRPDLAKPFYQRLHPVMLDALDLAAPDPVLRAMADRWRTQFSVLAIGRATSNKLSFRLYRGMRPSPA